MIFMNGHYLGYFESLGICNKLTNKSKAKNKWMWKTKTGVWVTTTQGEIKLGKTTILQPRNISIRALLFSLCKIDCDDKKKTKKNNTVNTEKGRGWEGEVQCGVTKIWV